MPLDTYNRKRNFAQTSEPPGDTLDDGPRVPRNAPRFVVQEHHASHLHYDFRLEMDGVLKSWAVPKGPPPDPTVKRLAMQTEDHPISYIDFSGVIPAGNYGAGTVSIWDSGTFEIVGEGDPSEGVRRGKLEVILRGSRLSGKYDLVRTDDERGQWLFIKSREPGAPPQPARRGATTVTYQLPGATPSPMPSAGTVHPMLAVTLDKPFSDPKWQFEIKWDGYRALLFAESGRSQLVSRNDQPLDSSFPELADLGRWLSCNSIVADGEIVALNAEGRPVFQMLQNRFRGFRSRKAESSDKPIDATLVYMAFDILHCDGMDVTQAPLEKRRQLLTGLIQPGGPIRFSDHVIGDGIALFEKLRALGMEGIIAKRADSPYLQQRSHHWAKIKSHQTQDVVIGGYIESKSPGRKFASLLLGQFDADNEFVPIGHVGTGFNFATIEAIYAEMKPLERKESPFSAPARVNGKAHWLKPELVCEVKYSEITDDGQLRHPVFIQLRPDKPALECRLPSVAPSVKQEVAAGSKAPALTAAGLIGIDSALEKALAPDSSAINATPTVDHHKVKLTNLSKLYWPQTGATKRDLLRYYAAVAKHMLPHLLDRPLVLQRYPDGVDGKSFFQHDAPPGIPSFIRTFPVQESGGIVNYILCDDLACLLYCINTGSIPLHTWNVRTPAPEMPDRIVFDLDPGGDFSSTIYVAHTLRSVLEEIGLASYPKTSGASGLHIYVPIQPIYPSEVVVSFGRLIAQIVQQRMPDLVTIERLTRKRGSSQVYLDFLQNGVGKTVVAPYSVRARPTPTVSTPLSWDEVTVGLNPAAFTIDSVPERLLYSGDLFLPVIERPQELGRAIAMLSGNTASRSALRQAAPAAAVQKLTDSLDKENTRATTREPIRGRK